MKTLYIIIISIIVTYSPLAAQDYWQQEVDYKINVALNDSLHTLDADIEIVYTNNSPDELSFIYFHLWPNAYKTETTALCEQMLMQGNTDLYMATEEERGNISEIDFKGDNKTLKWEFDPENIDIAKVFLNKPLKSGDKITITTPFKVKIPSSDFSRLGHSKQSYQITQWYPKPAVYDAKGWHQMPYLNTGEFYSEYGTYDVAITLPKNYILGATGDMVNGEKENQWLDSISEQTKLIESFDDDDLDFPASSKETKTLVFHQEKVHDFAWFADKRYHVLREEIELENGHKVLMQAMFTNQEADIWMQSLKYLEQATRFYSDFVGNYPYNHVTAVQGALSAGAGMEYPNITIIGISGDKYILEETIMHEVGHNWFYGLLGFNEREHPWMDEGINSFVQNMYMAKYHSDLAISELYFGSNTDIMRLNEIDEMYINYISNRVIASYNLDQACGLHSAKYTEANYGVSVYQKTSMVMDYLQLYLGKEEFSRIFKGFYEQWKYKHPQPDDFVAYFEKESGKDLSWFIDGLINSKDRVDYKISSVDTQGDSTIVTIKNKGKIYAPVYINAVDDGGVSITKKWVDGFDGKKQIALPKGEYHNIKINSGYSFMDYNPGNNHYQKDKLLPKSKKLKFKFITTLPKADEQYIYYTPVLGWNNYNKFMLGFAIFNHSLMEKKWEYELMPLYSFKQQTINGSFGLHRNLYFHKGVQRLSIGVVGKKYEYNTYNGDGKDLSYLKISPEITAYFQNPAGDKNISHIARVRLVYINRETNTYDDLDYSMHHVLSRGKNEYSILDIDYKYQNNRKINPYGIEANYEMGSAFSKISISLNYALTITQNPKKAFEIRVFAGKLFDGGSSGFSPPFYMSSIGGKQDYMYDYTYLDRSQQGGAIAHQMTPTDGGFYLPSAIGRSRNMILAANLRTPIPFINVVKLYGNLGYTFGNKYGRYDNKAMAEAGVLLTFFNRTFEVYFPLLWTQNFQDVMDLRPDYKYSDNIRFTLRMDLMDPFKYKKEFNL